MSASIWQPGDVGNFSTVNADNTVKTERLAVGVKGQVLCNIISFAYAPNTGSLEVFINGVRQQSNIDYVETNSTSFTLVEALEDGDLVDVKGLIGSSGAQTAASSASQAAISASQAAATYQNILGLQLPALPLSFANGGFGASYANKTQAFTAISPLSAKGDLVVFDGANSVRLPASTNGYQLVLDSTQPTGLKWVNVPAVYSSVVTAPTANVLLSYTVNYNYVTYNGAGLTLDATGIPTNTIVKFIGVNGASYTVKTANNIQVNFPAVEVALTNNTVPQGVWTGTVNYGRAAATIPGNTFLASFQFDANTIILVTCTSGNTTQLYLTPYNLLTKDVGTSYTESGMAVVGSIATADATTVNLFSASATTFVLAYKTSGSSGYVRAYSLVGGAITGGNVVSAAYSNNTSVNQISASSYIAIGTTANQVLATTWNLAGTTFTQAYTGALNGGATGNVSAVVILNSTALLIYYSDSNLGNHKVLPFTITAGILTAGAVVLSGLPYGPTYSFNSFLAPGTTDTGVLVATNTGTNVSSLIATKVTANVATVGAVVTSTIPLGTPYAHFAGTSSRALTMEIYNNFIIGTTVVFAGALGTQSVRVAGTTVTLGVVLGTSMTRVFYSQITGNYYIVDNVSNTIKQLIPNAGTTALAYGPTLAAVGIPASNGYFISEQLMNNVLYSYNAGTGASTSLGVYNVMNAGLGIYAILDTGTKAIIAANATLIDRFN